MMLTTELSWLPARPDWATTLGSIEGADISAWESLQALANSRLDFLGVNRIDRKLQRLFGVAPPAGLDGKPVRLAVMSNSTTDHLLPGLRVGGLRRGLHLTTFAGDFGLFYQELNDRGSKLHAFKPTAALFSFDAVGLLGAADAAIEPADASARIDGTIERLRHLWQLAQAAGAGQIIQQTVLPLAPALLGSNEHRLAGSQRSMTDRLNERIREAADRDGVDVLALDQRLIEDGLSAWHDPVLWHRAKQQISPKAAPAYGDLVARLLAAQQGKSSKCLVLDLDNTLWGGVIGDDGLEGIVLGQGNSLGEAFVAFQTYVKELSRRGVILAVCSKNDEANALAPFEKHPDMVLKREDIACFVANWQDKPSNLRAIAKTLNIGINSLAFADDNPFERTLVRRELPMIAVPELPEDPALYAKCIADAGYFESLRVTSDDVSRAAQYQGNIRRELLRASSTDVTSYLKSLAMRLEWRRFDKIGLQRVVQLINKTNQFNLTTQRYTQAEVLSFMEDPGSLTLQLRLTDAFGDNGIIGVIIGRPANGDAREIKIDTWLMSCRVLGRQVEEATLNLVASEAARLGAESLLGEYRPSTKNNMVREHYARLGFAQIGTEPDGSTYWRRSLHDYIPTDTFIDIREGQQ